MTSAAVGRQDARDDDRTRRDKQVRWWTRWFRVLPDFIIIGGMRCGTTSLYAYLSEHQQVLPAAKKELHFFDRRFDHGLGWYRARFPLVTAKAWHRIRSGHRAVTGEATPFYLYHPASAVRIAEILPEA